MSSIILLRLSISLLRLLIFSFAVVSGTLLIAHWSIILVALKSLSSHCDVHYLDVGIYWLSFFIQLEMFLILGLMSNFQLEFELFVCVRRFWILFKPFGLAGFIWHCSGRGMRGSVSPCYCQVGVDVQVPCSACTDIQGGNATVLGWRGGLNSPGSVHWLSGEVGLIIAG